MRAGREQVSGRGRPVPRPAARHATYSRDGAVGRVGAAPAAGPPPVRHAAGPYPAGHDPEQYSALYAPTAPAPPAPLDATAHTVAGGQAAVAEQVLPVHGPAARVPRPRQADAGVHRARRRGTPSGLLGNLTEMVVVVGLALALALVVKTFLVQAFYIPSESMETTLLVGDRILVSKLTPGPFELHRGDVVVFADPGNWLKGNPAPPPDGAVRHALRSALTFVGLLPQDSGEHLVKRVVGLPGDTVACCDAQGRVTVDGVPVEESYLRPGVPPSTLRFSVKVPAGRLWVMGDNRSYSEDSRYHTDENGGTVPVSDVVGKAFVVVWPVQRVGRVTGPGTTFDDVPTTDGDS